MGFYTDTTDGRLPCRISAANPQSKISICRAKRQGPQSTGWVNSKIEIRSSNQFQTNKKTQGQIRNSNLETNLNDHKRKIPNTLVWDFRFLDLGFECLGLFRISSFGFRILIR